MDILFMNPYFTKNVWGGTKLRDVFRYPVEGDNIGECWGIAAHPDGSSTIASGEFRGMLLKDLYELHPELFGNPGTERFPLLTKIIDAMDDLSIQVHPDNDYAFRMENGSYGKCECWYILEAEEGATLVVGHNAKTHEELSDMIHEGRFRELIREIPVKKGDFVEIDPGTVHAIKGGITLLETQQNSDITYRLYDYDRLWHGKHRELHIDKSIDVITVPAANEEECVLRAETIDKMTVENELSEFYSNAYYRIFRLKIRGAAFVCQEYPFLSLSVLEGAGAVNGHPLKKGDHFILPNGIGDVCFEGEMELLASTVKLQQ